MTVLTVHVRTTDEVEHLQSCQYPNTVTLCGKHIPASADRYIGLDTDVGCSTCRRLHAVAAFIESGAIEALRPEFDKKGRKRNVLQIDPKR